MLLIGIKSCQRDRMQKFHQAIRETWGKDLESVALGFFVGDGWTTLEALCQDEIVLDVPDDYRSLPHKTRTMLRWFLETEYSHIFLCDNDTFIIPSLFLKLPWQEYDYSGKFGYWPTGSKMGTTFRYDDGQGNTHDPCHAWASGGFGYCLSKKAAQIVVDTEPMSWAEDLYVGQCLGPKIISGEIRGYDPDHYNVSSFHFQKHIKPFTVEDIYEAYRLGRPEGPKWGFR